jgi:hypothetical protein
VWLKKAPSESEYNEPTRSRSGEKTEIAKKKLNICGLQNVALVKKGEVMKDRNISK